MIFKQAFSWLYSHTTDLSLAPSPTTLAACLQAIDAANGQYDETLKTYRGLKYVSSQHSELLQIELDKLKICEQFLVFLRRCEVMLQDLRPHSMVELMLTIALDNLELQSKIAPTFAFWLRQEPKRAIEYYETYYDSVDQKVRRESPEATIVLLLGAAAVQHELTDLRLSLQYQDNPLAICRLLAPVSANPTRYAAFIIWMLEQRVSIKQLVQSGVLQQFLGYHFDSLYSDVCEDSLNPVALLYGLLQQLECAMPLVDYAKQVACDIRGHAVYNLLGQQQASLVIIDKITEFPLLTRTAANIKQIIHVFGQQGLCESVRTLFHMTDTNPLDDPFQRALIECVLETPALITPALIKQVAEDRVMELSRWVVFIDDRFFQQWLDSNELAVLYLIPQKPHWLKQVTIPILTSFLDLIQAAYHPGAEAENMRLLMCLYQIASLHQVDLVDSIYEQMIDLTLRHRYLLEDDTVFRTLRLFRSAKKYVDKKADAVCQKLEDITHDFLNQPLLDGDFSRLTSGWSWLSSQMEVLQLVHAIKVVFPKREIDLMIYLFQHYSLTENPSWDQLMDALKLTDKGALVAGVKSRQALLSLLTSVDDEQLRSMIIDMLKVGRTFVRHRLLFNAIHVGNKGFLDWYLQRAPLDIELFEQAIASKQWPMMAHWMANHALPGLSEDQIDNLLVEATESRNIELIRLVIGHFGNSFSESTIALAMRVASQHDDDKALYCLYGLKPTSRALQVAFAQAIHQQNPHAIAFFTGMKKEKPNLADEMKRAFNSAVKNNDLSLVTQLTRCAANGPSRHVIQVAMEKALDRHQTEMVAVLKGVLSTSSLPPKTQARNLKSNQSFCSTESLAHLSLFASPKEVSLSAEQFQSAQAARASATPP